METRKQPRTVNCISWLRQRRNNAAGALTSGCSSCDRVAHLSFNASPMPRMAITILTTVAVAYLLLCAGLFALQRYLIYLPQPRLLGTDASMVMLTPSGERVQVSVRSREGPNALVYFGGNAEDVSQSLRSLSTTFPDHALFLLHYRGFGESSGTPSEEALFTDGLALFDQVRASHQHVAIVGSSLGSGVAVYVASLRPAARLVLVTPYDSFQDVVAGKLPYVPVRWLLRDKFESGRYAPKVTAPTLILMAEHDEMIPRASTERLHSRFRSGLASLHVIPGTNHNSIYDSPQYIPLLKGLP